MKNDSRDDTSSASPLIQAAAAGDTWTMTALLEAGAEVDSQDEGGSTALSWAARIGNLAAVQLLMQTGADIRHRDRICRDRMPVINDKGETTGVYERRYGYSVLECACQSSNTEVVALLLDAGLDVNERGWKEHTPLMLVESPAVAKLLLQRGARVDDRAPTGWTALFRSTFFGNPGVMRVLLDHGADVNAVDCEGHTALMWVFRSDVLSIIERHVKPDLGALGEHPLIMEIVKILVENGADIHRTDSRGRTAIFHALEYLYLDAAEYLIKRGALLDIPPGREESVHEAALKQGRSRLLAMIMRKRQSVERRVP